MMRRALAAAIVAGLPVTLATGACGTAEWEFWDPASRIRAESSLDGEMLDAQPDAPVSDSPEAHDRHADGPCEPDAVTCPVSCAGGASCPSDAPVCTSPGLICMPCRSNDDCNMVRSGPLCSQDGTCVPECFSDRSCPASRPRCDRPIGRCVRCLSDTDCPSGEVCYGSRSCGLP
jgi:Cys-rich repeat protein